MAYPPHFLLAFGGQLVTTSSVAVESWVCGLRLRRGDATAATQSEQDAAAAGYATAIKTWFEDSATTISSVVTLEYVKCNEIDTNGRYKHPYSSTYLLAPASTGGGGAVKYPPQVAYAISLRTGQRGPRYRGRFYMPSPTAPVQSTLLAISLTSAAAIAASTATMIGTINTGSGLWGTATEKPKVAVVSKFGTVTDVEEVWCGQALDTVRDRRKSIPENYSVHAV